jgi:hypothetical protein
MGFGSALRAGIAVADKLTGGSDGFQGTVQHYCWVGDLAHGQPDYAPFVLVDALIDERTMRRRLPTGDEIIVRATITILRSLEPNGATNRHEPIDTRDKFVLPSGFTGPILDISSPPLVGDPAMFTILLGANE